MRMRNSITRLLLLSMLSVALVSNGILGYLWISQEYTRFHQESEELSRRFISEQRETIREEVLRTIDYIDYMKRQTEARLRASIRERVYEGCAIAESLHARYKDTRSLGEIREIVRETLRPVQYNNGRGYYFAFTMKGVGDLYGIDPKLEGTSFLGFVDESGKYVVQDMMALVREKEEGFYEYTWAKPNTEGRDHRKISFVKHVPSLDWILGCGDYLDDVEGEIQQEILDRISEIRFGADGYLFINTFDGTTLTHHDRSRIGKNYTDLTDANGVRIHQELLQAARQPEGGYAQYIGSIRPSTGKPAPKLSYAKSYDAWGWVVGTGVYLDDLEAMIAARRADLEETVQWHIARIVALFVALVSMTYLVAKYTARRTKQNFDMFSSFFKQASHEATFIDPAKLHFGEFEVLAEHANRMIERRLATERELRNMELEVRQSEKMQAIGELAGGIAHDFNNQLGGIMGFTDLLLAKLHDPKLEEYAEGIITSAERAAGLTAQLLTFARKGPLQTIPVNLHRVIGEVHILLEHSIDKRIHIALELEAERATVIGDPTQLQNAILNVAINARDAMPEGGEMNFSTHLLALDEAACADTPFEVRPGEYLAVAIRDNGLGMDEETRNRMFEPFFTTKGAGRGTGMGLAAVYGTIKNHHGALRVESAPGEGTCVTLLLPLAEETREASAAPARDVMARREATILLVDDEETLRQSTENMLKELGYQVLSCGDGKEAVECYARSGDAIDLVLLDMIMPEMGGRETFRALREINPDVRVVLISGMSAEKEINELLAGGVRGFVQKPFRRSVLSEAVDEALGDN